MASSIDNCRAMIEASRRAGQLLMIGYRHLFDPIYLRAREILHATSLGTIIKSPIESGFGYIAKPGWRLDPRYPRRRRLPSSTSASTPSNALYDLFPEQLSITASKIQRDPATNLGALRRVARHPSQRRNYPLPLLLPQENPRPHHHPRRPSAPSPSSPPSPTVAHTSMPNTPIPSPANPSPSNSLDPATPSPPFASKPSTLPTAPSLATRSSPPANSVSATCRPSPASTPLRHAAPPA